MISWAYDTVTWSQFDTPLLSLGQPRISRARYNSQISRTKNITNILSTANIVSYMSIITVVLTQFYTMYWLLICLILISTIYYICHTSYNDLFVVEALFPSLSITHRSTLHYAIHLRYIVGQIDFFSVCEWFFSHNWLSIEIGVWEEIPYLPQL